VTRRRRTELVLLLIVRRAERDAAMSRRARSEEPDASMVIGEECPPDESGSRQPS
jgi:hypothetical protein